MIKKLTSNKDTPITWKRPRVFEAPCHKPEQIPEKLLLYNTDGNLEFHFKSVDLSCDSWKWRCQEVIWKHKLREAEIEMGESVA
jgi:hypothetical protein